MTIPPAYTIVPLSLLNNSPAEDSASDFYRLAEATFQCDRDAFNLDAATFTHDELGGIVLLTLATKQPGLTHQFLRGLPPFERHRAIEKAMGYLGQYHLADNTEPKLPAHEYLKKNYQSNECEQQEQFQALYNLAEEQDLLSSHWTFLPVEIGGILQLMIACGYDPSDSPFVCELPKKTRQLGIAQAMSHLVGNEEELQQCISLFHLAEKFELLSSDGIFDLEIFNPLLEIADRNKFPIPIAMLSKALLFGLEKNQMELVDRLFAFSREHTSAAQKALNLDAFTPTMMDRLLEFAIEKDLPIQGSRLLKALILAVSTKRSTLADKVYSLSQEHFPTLLKHAVSELYSEDEPLLNFAQLEKLIPIADKYNVFKELKEIFLKLDSPTLIDALQTTKAWRDTNRCCTLQ